MNRPNDPMIMNPSDPSSFFRSPDAVAAVVEPDVLFRLLSRSYDLPADQAALVTREQGDRMVCKPGTEVARVGVETILLVRTTPPAMSFDGFTVGSVDGYQCAVSVRLRVSLIPEASELASFQKTVIGGSRFARVDALRDYLMPRVVRASAGVAEGRGVEVLIDPKNTDTFSAEVADGLKEAVFAAGLRIEKPLDVRFDSAVYRQLRRARVEARRRQEEFDARRRIARAVETAQTEHARHLSDLLIKLTALAERSPDHDLADWLRTFPETERGDLYAALLRVDDTRAATTRWVVAASGRELLFFSPDALGSPVRTVEVPESIGPVRSVQLHVDASDEQRLFVGASRGLYEMPLDGDLRADIITYATDPGARVQGGVNASALAGDHVFASHSELGLLCWKRGGADAACPVLPNHMRNARAVRCVCFFDGRLCFSIDERVCMLPADALDAEPDELTGSRSLITALCPSADGVYAGNADGEVLHWPAGRRDQPQVLHAGRRRSAESVALLDFGGLKRLFYTDTSLAVFARVMGDTFICRYEAAGQTVRRAEVAPDLIVGTNDVRDRLIFWRPGRPGTPLGVVSVARLTRHSIQDVCLVPTV